MMNDMSLKAKIRNIAKTKNISAQAVLQTYLMNRFLFPKSHDMKEYNFTMPKTAIKGLVRVLQKIPKWKRIYRNDSILDGEVWKIKFVYGEMIIDTTGVNAYPFGFKLVIKKIQNELEKLCKEYADDYSRKEFKKHKLFESL